MTTWITQPEMAQRIGIRNGRLDNWRCRGKIGNIPVKVERRRVYYRAEDQQVIARCLMSSRTKWSTYVDEFTHFCGFGTKLWAVQAVARAYDTHPKNVAKALERAGIHIEGIYEITERTAA
ncbi:hypothetical protein [Corynebacterium cystitidis]|uniref:hypothetical protein n=1 Tax=Corynebacterium cystitidis TaxID=35757 RepID=UPI00211EB760|nr:hypothetical protein [Corynebacterium cystitidis]